MHLCESDTSKLSQSIYVIAYFSPLKTINVSLEILGAIHCNNINGCAYFSIYFMETDGLFIKKQSVLIK